MMTVDFKDKANIFSILLFVMLFAQALTVTWLCGMWSGSPRIAVQTAAASSLILTLPYFLVNGRWRWTMWLVIIPLSILLFTNVVYFHVFHHFYWLSQINLTNVTSKIVVDGGLAQISASDLLVLLEPTVLGVFWLLWRRQIAVKQYPGFLRVLAGCLIPIIALSLFVLGVRRDKLYRDTVNKENTWKDSLDKVSLYTVHPLYKEDVWKLGGPLFVAAHYFIELIPLDEPMGKEELASAKLALEATADPTAGFSHNVGKNLILLIVESFNATVLGDDIQRYNPCPTVMDLISDSTTVYVPEVLTQVGEGISADGQFILNTGLYPIVKRRWTPDIFRGDYPSIAKALKGYHSAEAICEQKEFYCHDQTTLSYGYGHLYYNLALGEGGYEEADTRLMNAVIRLLPELPHPFALEITTLSMHSPYDKCKVKSELNIDTGSTDIDSRGVNYLRAVKSFDSALCSLVSALKSSGLYDDTVIAIVGDHSALNAYLPQPLHTDCVPLIIVNAGVCHNYARQIGQVDVFPSLLDVMGVEEYVYPLTGKPYRGLGKSIFSPAHPGGAINRQGVILGNLSFPDSILSIWDISERLIQTGFFR